MYHEGSLGDRMKLYEKENLTIFAREKPIIIRIDGKAFHTFTRGLKKPFDNILIETMQETTLKLCEEIQGVSYGYTQSDEISLVIMPPTDKKTQLWFNGNVQKIVSIVSSMATLYFNEYFIKASKAMKTPVFLPLISNTFEDKRYQVYESKFFKAIFDCRAFQIDLDDVSNYVIWRQKDAIKNSVSSIALNYYSNKELKHKNSLERIELLKEKQVNFYDLKSYLQRGTEVKHMYGNERDFSINLDMKVLTYDEFFLRKKTIIYK